MLFEVEQMIDRIVENVVCVILAIKDLIEHLLYEHAVCYAAVVSYGNKRKPGFLCSYDDFRIHRFDTSVIEIDNKGTYSLLSEVGNRLLLSSYIVPAGPEMCNYHLILEAVTLDPHIEIVLIKHGYGSDAS